MSLTYANIEDVLTGCFLSQWNNRTPVILKNQQQTVIPVDADAWVRFSVLRTANKQRSMGIVGNRRFVRVGRIFVQVYVRSGEVTELLNELCYAVVNMYETFCEYPEIRILQIRQEDEPDGATPTAKVTADGAWFGTTINIQFAFDEVK